MNEKKIAEQIISGDDEAFRWLVNTYQKTVLNICYHIVRDKETAKDVTQDVFVLVYNNMSCYRGESGLKTWISRIAIRKAIDHLKASQSRKRFFWFRNKFSVSLRDVTALSKESESPDFKTENDERRTALDQAISALSENQRIAFLLSYNEDMTAKDIAAAMNLSVASVESLIYRAKKSLKKTLFNKYKNDL